MKGALNMLLALLALSAAGSAFSQDTTLASVASGVPDLSTLVQAVSVCPSVLALATSNTTAVTLFAPTNEAFNAALAALNLTLGALLSDTPLLCEILSYHIVPEVVNSSAVTTTPVLLPTLLAGDTVTVQLINGTVYVNNAKVIMPDVPAGLSIVHVIDNVLTLPATPSPSASNSTNTTNESPAMGSNSTGTGSGSSPVGSETNVTIASVASTVPDLSTFLTAVQACPPILAAATDPSTAVTVFAPTNEAFASLLADNNESLDALLNDTSSLCAVLELHVVPQVIPASAATETPLSVPTLLPSVNDTIQLINGTVHVNNAEVTTADVSAGNSIVHVINQVLQAQAPTTPSPSPVEFTPSPAYGVGSSPAYGGSPSPAYGGSPSPAYGGSPPSPSPAYGNQPPIVFVPTPMPTPPPSPMETPSPSPVGSSPVETTIASVAATLPDLSILLEAVSECPSLLAAASTATTNVTVFAPTNEAFTAYLNKTNMTAAELLANTTLLCSVLEFHIVAGAIPASEASTLAMSITTLSGKNTTIQLLNGTVYVNNARVIMSDVYAGASIIHVIDAVISTTPTIASVAGMYPSIEAALATAVTLPEFLAMATNPDIAVTAFVPTNQAFLDGISKLAYELSITVDQLSADHDFLFAIFSYHITPVVFNTSYLVGDDEVRLSTYLAKAHVSLQDHHNITMVDQYTRITIPNVEAGNSLIQIINKLLLPTNYDSYYKGPAYASKRRAVARRALRSSKSLRRRFL